MKRKRCGWLALIAAGMVVTLSAQAPAPTFEVASIKRAEPGIQGGRVRFLPGGRFSGENVYLEFVLQQVYGVRAFQIIAAPQWKAIIGDGRDQRYQIEAKGPESATEAQLKEMAKTLLADRFQLRVHKETRDLPVYALVVAKDGVKGARPNEGKRGGITLVLPGWIRGQRIAPGFLAETLSSYVDRPVLDRTNLTQLLDFDLTWTPQGTGSDVPGCPLNFQDMAKRMKITLPTGCPSLFTAVQEQLGLRLEPQQGPVEVLVIDSVQPLIDN
jgi:bla regulator protein blaR1